MQFNAAVPIYLQLMTAIKLKIVSGQMKPGDKIPSVRELAMTYEVNPNTMQKALSELEREGLLYSQRTSGRFVADEGGKIDQLRQELAEARVGELVSSLLSMGFSKEEIIRLITGYLEGMTV